MSQIAVYNTSGGGGGTGTVTSVTGGTGINITGVATINPTVNLTVPVVIANGGTNATSFATTDGVVIYNGTRLVTLASTGTAGQILVSNGAGVAPSFQTNSGGTITLTADVGSATGDPILIHGTHNINTSGSGSTITVAGNNAIIQGNLASLAGVDAITVVTGNITVDAGIITLPNTTATTGYIQIGNLPFLLNQGNSNAFFGGAGNFTTGGAGGTNNVGGGEGALFALTTGTDNCAYGLEALSDCTSGTDNSAFGADSLANLTTGQFNCAVGSDCLPHITTTSNNTAIGYGAGNDATFTTGHDNILIGYLAGSSLATNESSNIIVGNIGTVSDGHTIRIGTQGSSAGQQDLCFIAGITGVTTSNSNMVTINTSTGQLGAAALPASFTWAVITADQSAVVNNGYIANKSGLLTLTLPTVSAVGSLIELTGMNTALGWKIAQNANQIIHFGNTNTTTGVGGSLASTLTYDAVRIVCNVANLEWIVLSAQGNITIV